MNFLLYTYIHTYLCSFTHTYIHTCMQTYIHTSRENPLRTRMSISDSSSISTGDLDIVIFKDEIMYVCMNVHTYILRWHLLFGHWVRVPGLSSAVRLGNRALRHTLNVCMQNIGVM